MKNDHLMGSKENRHHLITFINDFSFLTEQLNVSHVYRKENKCADDIIANRFQLNGFGFTIYKEIKCTSISSSRHQHQAIDIKQARWRICVEARSRHHRTLALSELG